MLRCHWVIKSLYIAICHFEPKGEILYARTCRTYKISPRTSFEMTWWVVFWKWTSLFHRLMQLRFLSKSSFHCASFLAFRSIGFRAEG